MKDNVEYKWGKTSFAPFKSSYDCSSWEYLKRFFNEIVPDLSKEFGDVIRFWLASIPMAAEAPEVIVRADCRLGGILPYCEKSVVAGNSKFKNISARSLSPGTSFGGYFEEPH